MWTHTHKFHTLDHNILCHFHVGHWPINLGSAHIIFTSKNITNHNPSLVMWQDKTNPKISVKLWYNLASKGPRGHQWKKGPTNNEESYHSKSEYSQKMSIKLSSELLLNWIANICLKRYGKWTRISFPLIIMTYLLLKQWTGLN